MQRITFVVILVIVTFVVLANRYSGGRMLKSTGENRTTTSRDGTTIAFTKRGSGPPLIIVDGAFCYRENGPATELASRLAQHFTVFTYDRRGRGESRDTAPYATEREIDDLQALAREAGNAPFVVGVSSGGALILQAVASGCSNFQIRPEILEFRTGAEYALDTGALNQINSVAARFPVAFGSMSTFTFSPMGGVEGGRNFITEGHLAGSYAIFRGIAGTDASYRFRVHPSWLFSSNPYTLTGIFRARFPAIAEEFSTESKPGAYTRTLDTRLRPYGRAELTIPLSRIVSTAVVYQYGALPPAFLFFGHTISASIKISGPADSER